MPRSHSHLLFVTVIPVIAASIVALAGCKDQAPVTNTSGTSGSTGAHDDHDHDHDDDHDHGAAAEHGHGATVALGEQIVDGFVVKASRDGEIKAGGDAPIDVWISLPAGSTSILATVRFWIGTEDAKGSLKAKAEIENDNWHTHVEVPDPLPAGSKLWVEFETGTAEKRFLGFDLKN
ncbi:MAG: hypothetical protein SGJ11_05100 [Phycisphaerae bacterium]|nr:hypothetical protein [Phycisphaerae bacterium]